MNAYIDCMSPIKRVAVIEAMDFRAAHFGLYFCTHSNLSLCIDLCAVALCVRAFYILFFLLLLALSRSRTFVILGYYNAYARYTPWKLLCNIMRICVCVCVFEYELASLFAFSLTSFPFPNCSYTPNFVFFLLFWSSSKSINAFAFKMIYFFLRSLFVQMVFIAMPNFI